MSSMRRSCCLITRSTRRSNEHIVVLEQGGQAIRCRSVTRRPEVNKWDAESIRSNVASPRVPNPEGPSRPDFDIDKTRLPRPAVPPEDVGRALCERAC